MSSRTDRRAEDGGVQGQTPTVYQYGDGNSSIPLSDEVEETKAENLDASSMEVKKLKKRFLRMFRLGKEKQEAPGEVSMTTPAGDNVDVPTVAADLLAPSATMDDPDASVDVSKPSRNVDKIAEMPSFGGKVEVPTPVVSVDASAPSADRSGLKGPDKTAVDVPSVGDNVGVSTPDVSVNVSTAPVDVGGKMPDVFRGVPDVSAEVPQVDDVGMSAPDVSTSASGVGVDVSAEVPKVDDVGMSAPDVSISAPDVDLDVSAEVPKVDDVGTSGPDVIMSAPGVGVSGDSAKVEDIKAGLPDAPSVEGKTTKKGLRRIIDLAKKKLEALEIKGSVPDVKVPEVSGDISAPSASGGVSMPSAPDVDVPKPGVEVNVPAPGSTVDVSAPEVSTKAEGETVDSGITEHTPIVVAAPVILGGRRSGGRRLFSKYLGRKDNADASDVTGPDMSVYAPNAKMSAPTVDVLAAKNVADESASLKIYPVSKPDADSEDAKNAELDSSKLSAAFDAAIGAVDDERTSGVTTEGDLVPLPPVPEASPDGDSDLSQKLDADVVPVEEGQADDEDTDIDVEAPVDHDSVTGGVIGFLFGGGEARHEEGQPQDEQGSTEETPAAASEDSTPAAKSGSDVTSSLKESLAGLSRDNDTLTSMLFGPSPKDKVTDEPAAESTSKQSDQDKDDDKNDGGFFGMIAEKLGLIRSNEKEDETAAPAAADAGATT